MKTYNITDVKAFTSGLFLEPVFDNFLVTEAAIVSACTVLIDGASQSEAQDAETHVTWGSVRHIACSAVKGDEPPRTLRIVLKLSRSNLAATLRAMDAKENEVDGLYLNIRFDKGELTCTTGCSFASFTMDKSAERGWEGFVEKFLRKNGDEFNEL